MLGGRRAASDAVAHLARPSVGAKNTRRDRLMALAARPSDGVLGVVEATGGRRVAPPALPAWAAPPPRRLLAQAVPQGEAEPQAWGGSGALRTAGHQVRLRVVQGRPGRHVPTALRRWRVPRMAAERPRGLGRLWDTASWPISREVRAWVRAHHQRVKREGGPRLTGRFPVKSPGWHPIEPRGLPGKRARVEPTRPLTATASSQRVGDDVAVQPMAPLQQHGA